MGRYPSNGELGSNRCLFILNKFSFSINYKKTMFTKTVTSGYSKTEYSSILIHKGHLKIYKTWPSSKAIFERKSSTASETFYFLPID
jgi:hypothetical protein